MVMGNAGWLPSVMPEVFCRASMLLFFLDSRQKIAGMTEGALDSRQSGNDRWGPGFPPEDCGNDFLSVMPEVFCRASMFLSFLDSRQKNAGMTEGALDSRQKIAGMTDGALDSGFHRNDE